MSYRRIARAPIVCPLLAAAALLAALPATAARSGCDRDCLTGHVDAYLAALIARDASRLPLAREVRFTENLVPLQLGREGLWQTVTGRGRFNLYVADTKTGNASWIGTVEENGKPLFMALRLKIVAGRIAEAETLLGRIALNSADTVGPPRADFARVEPQATRSTRPDLIAMVSRHWDGMEQGSGELAPYTDDCERYDNGQRTTGPRRPPAPGEPAGDVGLRGIGELTCKGQMASGRFRNGNRVYPRRVWGVDEERGLVVGYYSPNVPGTAREVQVFGVPFTVGPDELLPFTIQQVELFKVVGGRISRVEVVLGPRVPYGMRSPFDMRTLWQPR
jgi:hypothetical protein